MNRHDVVVVGGGHSGVLAAGVLAMHGLDVVLIERNYSLGGLAGQKHVGGLPSSRYAYVIGLVPPELMREFPKAFPRTEHADPSWVSLAPDESIEFRWWSRIDRLKAELRERGIDPGILNLIAEFWKCYKSKGLYFTPSAPSLDDSIEALESDKACKDAVNVLKHKSAEILSWFAPREYWDFFIYPSMLYSNGFVLAYYLQNNNIWHRPVYSMTSFSKSLRSFAEQYGVKLILGESVTSFSISRGRVNGVKLSNGKTIYSRAVLFSAPITSLLDIEGHELLPENEIRALEKLRENITLRASVKRVDLVVARRPSPPSERSWLGKPIYVYWRGDMGGEYVYGDCIEGKCLVQFSGIVDNPTKLVPPGVSEDDIVLRDVRDRKTQIRCCKNYTGHPDHVPMVDGYLFNNRPLPGWGNYRTPIPCLYHGSVSSYPGGEVNGVAGLNAAIRILIDLGVRPRINLVAHSIKKRDKESYRGNKPCT
jgi:phytoene dehydrogenase-like protein